MSSPHDLYSNIEISEKSFRKTLLAAIRDDLQMAGKTMLPLNIVAENYNSQSEF